VYVGYVTFGRCQFDLVASIMGLFTSSGLEFDAGQLLKVHPSPSERIAALA
jgi:hypothetical protein